MHVVNFMLRKMLASLFKPKAQNFTPFIGTDASQKRPLSIVCTMLLACYSDGAMIRNSREPQLAIYRLT